MFKTTNQFSLILPADHPEGCGKTPHFVARELCIETSHGGISSDGT